MRTIAGMALIALVIIAGAMWTGYAEGWVLMQIVEAGQ